MYQRIFLFLVLLGLVLWISPWIAIAAATVFSFFQSSHNYYEIILIGVISDSIYNTFLLEYGWFHAPLFTTISAGVFLVLILLQRRMNMYA